MIVVWVLVGLALAMGMTSLLGDRKRGRYIRARLLAAPHNFLPATVIVPVKGPDARLGENLAALASLDYPDYELLVTARSERDIPAGVVPGGARLVIAGDGDPASGEKINNLLAAVGAARPESEVFAFADSDGCVGPRWLQGLVAGLEQKKAGAATGYRVYLPEEPGLWALCRSIWNAVVGGDFGPGDNRIAWGGAMAIRRDLFLALRVPEHWRGSVSDDYGLARAVHESGLHIVFEPEALVVSSDATGGRELLHWIQRQMILTRVYAPRLWGLAVFAHLVYCGAMAASAAMAFHGNMTGVYTLFAQVALSCAKGGNRLRILRWSLPNEEQWLRRHGWAHIWLVPLGTWLWLFGLLASAVTNVIHWRGNRYRLTATSFEKL